MRIRWLMGHHSISWTVGLVDPSEGDAARRPSPCAAALGSQHLIPPEVELELTD